MLVSFITVFLLFLSFFSSSACSQKVSQKVTFSVIDEQCEKKLAELLSQDFFLEGVSYTCDVHFQEQEFFYLTELKKNAYVTREQVCFALSMLFKKNKFRSIALECHEGVHGLLLHFTIKSFWTFKKLIIKGILLGQDIYRQYYSLEPGNRFDLQKHKHALQKVNESLKSDGFLTGTVSADLRYNQTVKEVTVQLNVKRNKRFIVKSVAVKQINNEVLDAQEQRLLNTFLEKKFTRQLKKRLYSKKIINSQTTLLKNYLAQRGFLNTSIVLHEKIDAHNKYVNLVFEINFLDKKEFVFFGNAFFSNEQLFQVINNFGQSAWLLPAALLAQELERYYRKKGFWKVAIESQEDKDRYFFVIQEGQRALVKKIVFKNVVALKERSLVSLHFKKVLKNEQFDQDIFNKACRLLVEYYHKNGFLDARILTHDFESVPDKKNGYTLVITVDEGERYYLNNVRIKNFEKLEHKGPFAQVHKKRKRHPLDALLLKEQRIWLVNYFHEQGYRSVGVTPEFVRHENNVDVIWHVKKGTKTAFGKTVVQGVSSFPFEYVQRELQYKDGDTWSKQRLKKSLAYLKELNIFDYVHGFPDYVHKHETSTDVLLKLQKDDPFEVKLRGGFGLRQVARKTTLADFTYKLGGDFFVKNPANVGDYVHISGDFSRSYKNVSGKYYRPWIFDIPINTLFQVYHSAYEYPGCVGVDHTLYEVIQDGFLTRFSKKINRVEVGVNVGVEWMKILLPSNENIMAARVAQAINFAPDFVKKRVPYFMIEPTLVIDFLDSPVSPTKGLFTLISSKSMVPFKASVHNAYFVKFLIEQSFFIPLKSLVLALRLRFGHILHKDFASIMPTERFYLGGANSIRSYATDQAPPLGEFEDEKGNKSLVPQGGKSMVNVNGEIRFPLTQNFAGVFFQDLGALSSTGVSELSGKLIAASGFGLRYNTPIGPLSFDIGFKWCKLYKDERLYAWFLTFGHAF